MHSMPASGTASRRARASMPGTPRDSRAAASRGAVAARTARAVGCSANAVPPTASRPAASSIAAAGEAVVARTPTSAGPSTKPTSSAVLSYDRAADSVRGRPRVSPIHRTRANGPTCGALAPVRAAAVRVSAVDAGGPGRFTATRATRATVASGVHRSSTARCPYRSASAPCVGPPTAVPRAAAAPARLPAATEPVAPLTSSRVPMVSIVNGSRAANATGRNQAPASRGSAE